VYNSHMASLVNFNTKSIKSVRSTESPLSSIERQRRLPYVASQIKAVLRQSRSFKRDSLLVLLNLAGPD